MESFKMDLSIIAKNISDARIRCSKSYKSCADLLGISTARYKKYESGEIPLTLPELETLSFFFGKPLNSILGIEYQETLDLPDAPEPDHLLNLLKIRNSVIGTLLQIEREKKGLSVKNLAALCDISATTLKRFENGSLGIPLDDLATIIEELELNLDMFLDLNSPIGVWQLSQKRIASFLTLPQELQDFIADKDNHPYLSAAQKMKDFSSVDFKDLSEAIRVIIQKLPDDTSSANGQEQEWE